LRGIADLKDLYEQESKNRQNLGTNWDIVKGWNERARYRLWTEQHARQLFQATSDPTDGVMPWLRIHY